MQGKRMDTRKKRIDKRDERTIIRNLLIGISFLVVPLVMNFFLEASDYTFDWELTKTFICTEQPMMFILSTTFLIVLLIWLFLLSGSILFSDIFLCAVMSVLIYANYKKIMFRREPVYPEDLAVLFEPRLLKNMAGTSLFVIILLLLIVLLCFLFYLIWKNWVENTSHFIKKILAFVLATGYLLLFIFFNFQGNPIKKLYDRSVEWRTTEQIASYQHATFIGAFFSNVMPIAMDPIEGYSESKIEEIVKKYKNQVIKQSVDSEEKPDIIYILSESYSDPTHLKGVEVSGDPLESYRPLEESSFSGNMFSYGYGGGTGSIEFEALTSFTMAGLNNGISPYPMVVSSRDDFPSIVSFLKKIDYRAVGIHPYDLSMYKRRYVYNTLGMDKQIGRDEIQDPIYIQSNPYISDETAFNEVLKELDEHKEESSFINLVTMQGHMPYTEKYSEKHFTVNQIERSEEIQNYLEDIYISSNAFNQFIEKVASREKRTIVVFYGDHLPGVYGEDILEKNNFETVHQTPFIIFDNKRKIEKNELSERDSMIVSPIYFSNLVLNDTSLPFSGYYQLLNNLYEKLPAFENEYYYNGKDWSKKINDSQTLELYKEYMMIEYDVIQGKKYSEKLGFFDPV